MKVGDAVRGGSRFRHCCRVTTTTTAAAGAWQLCAAGLTACMGPYVLGCLTPGVLVWGAWQPEEESVECRVECVQVEHRVCIVAAVLLLLL